MLSNMYIYDDIQFSRQRIIQENNFVRRLQYRTRVMRINSSQMEGNKGISAHHYSNFKEEVLVEEENEAVNLFHMTVNANTSMSPI